MIRNMSLFSRRLAQIEEPQISADFYTRILVLFFVFCLFLLAGCLNKKSGNTENDEKIKPYPHIINIEEGLKNNDQLKLSEIADSIRYVVLSKERKVLIGSLSRLQMTDNHIYINSDGLVMRFDLSGRFLNSFGGIGRGPEEYLEGSVFSTTPEDDKILILRSMMYDYLLYEPDGTYSGRKRLSYPRNMFDFVAMSDSSYLMTFLFIGSVMNAEVFKAMPAIAGLYDFGGNPVRIIEQPLKNKNISEADLKRIIIANPGYSFFNGRVVLFPEGDTIYEVDARSDYPGFIISWGKITHQQTTDEKFYTQETMTGKVVNYMPLFETYRKAYFRGRNMNDYFIFEYDKISGTCRSMLAEEDNIGLINNLDGGENYFPAKTNRMGDIWISYEDAIKFKERHSEDFLSKSLALYPDRKEKLQLFVNELKPDDNPVLKIVYLKNQKTE